jgi:hypothetical protein
VPVVYNILKYFNVHTAHQISLEDGDSLIDNGPLQIFKDEDFKYLQYANHVMELMRSDRPTVKSVVSTI